MRAAVWPVGAIAVALAVGVGAGPRGWLVQAVEELVAKRWPAERARVDRTRRIGRAGDEARAAFGLDALPSSSGCGPLLRAAATLPRRHARRGLDGDLLPFLHGSWGKTGGRLEEATRGPVANVEARMLEARGPLDAGELLAMCVSAAGSVEAGVLTCHNTLKSLAHRIRTVPPEHVAPRDARLVAGLKPWRRRVLTPAGEPDKLGPLYHLFATMTLGVHAGTAEAAHLAADVEGWRRTVAWRSDRPDPDKGAADRCGALAAGILLR